MPGTASRPRGPLGTGQSRPGQLVNPAGFGAGCESSRRAGPPRGPSIRYRVTWYSWSTPRTLIPECESPGRSGRLRGPSHPSASHPETRSTQRTLGHERESPGRAGQHRRPSDTGPSRLGQLIDTEGPLVWARVTRDSRSHHGKSDTGPSHPGELVDSAGTGTRAQVALDIWWTTRALG